MPRLCTALKDLIKLNSHHLSRLSIHWNHSDVFYVAASALRICLNLTELVVETCTMHDVTYKQPEWPRRRLRLSHLFLEGWKFSRTEIDDLLRICPDLRCLALDPLDMDGHNAVLSAVYDCCPHLEYLVYDS